jgi:integrase
MTSQPLPIVGVAGSARRVQQRLSEAVDVAMLVGLGWDPETQVYTPDPSHRLLGYRVCAVVGCGSEAWCRDGLCGGCTMRRSAAPDEPLAAFLAAGMGERRRPGQRRCRVCPQRPAGAANGLCLCCEHQRKVRGQDVAAFIDGDHRYPPAVPRPTTGPCQVVSCGRLVDHPVSGLCGAHHHAWRHAGKPVLAVFASTSSPRRGDRKGRVVLRGLPERVITELLLGVQAALSEGRRIMPTDLRAVVDHLRDRQVSAVADLDTAGLSAPVRHFLHFTADRARLACSDMASEYDKDVWDLRLWGWKGRLSFIGGDALHRNGRTTAPGIDQSWLKEAAKSWTADALTSTSPVTVRTILTAVGLFSEHLGRRPDHGQRPDVLDRVDVEAFLARLGHLQAAGRLTGYSRAQAVDTLARFLRDARAMGLTRPGGPLAGLPDQIAIRARDRSRHQQRREDDTGRALPQHVLAQLLDRDNLDAIQAQAGPGWRAAVELLAGVGRRPSELCGLRFDCLDYDEAAGSDGHPTPARCSSTTCPKSPRSAPGCRSTTGKRPSSPLSKPGSGPRSPTPPTISWCSSPGC